MERMDFRAWDWTASRGCHGTAECMMYGQVAVPPNTTHTHTHTTHTHLIENSAEPKELKSEFLKQNNMNKTAKIVHLLRTLTSMYLNISW